MISDNDERVVVSLGGEREHANARGEAMPSAKICSNAVNEEIQ
jgi:hypothetical protein